jgi:hypothetical protein
MMNYTQNTRLSLQLILLIPSAGQGIRRQGLLGCQANTCKRQRITGVSLVTEVTVDIMAYEGIRRPERSEPRGYFLQTVPDQSTRRRLRR